MEGKVTFCPDCGTDLNSDEQQDSEEEHELPLEDLENPLRYKIAGGVILVMGLFLMLLSFWAGVFFLIFGFFAWLIYAHLELEDDVSKQSAQMVTVVVLGFGVLFTGVALVTTTGDDASTSDPQLNEPPFLDETDQVPDYERAEVNDISTGVAVRMEVNVITSQEVDSLSDDELLTIAKDNVDTVVDEMSVNSVTVFYYNQGDDIEYIASARVEWAPDGDIANAGDVDTGDYSQHEFGLERLYGQ